MGDARGVRSNERSAVRRAHRGIHVLSLFALTACSTSAGPPAQPAPHALVVASFNFDESRIVAEIYAQALEDHGIPVHRELDLGSRELVLPALRQGLIDVVPEYLGTLLDTAARGPRSDQSDPALLRGLLNTVLEPWRLQGLEPAAASDQNALVVTRTTADERSLGAISDLAPIAAELTLGGPPECPTRERCLPGLEEAYALRFKEFRPFNGARLVRQALLDGVVDVGVLFTTDGFLAGDDLVLLTDDRHLQPPENVIPVVRTKAVASSGAVAVLNEVSAALTTSDLRFLNWRVSVAGGTAASEARGWLIRHGIVDR
jgi:osmoprotectant transport system substrate-binding protein